MLIIYFQVPNPFPIPNFWDRTEENLANKKIADDDRKYMVRVLATMLCTFKQSPSRNDCGVVAESLVRKFSFFKESVSFCKVLNHIIFTVVSFHCSTLGSNSYICGARM